MPRFELKEPDRHLSSYAGLMLIVRCYQAAQANNLDLRFHTSQGMKSSELVKHYVRLLTLGKSDFEAIEPFRGAPFLTKALGIGNVPSSVWLRQRLEKLAPDLPEETDDLSVRLLQRTEAPNTAENDYTCLDFDTFVLDKSGTKKEWVSRTSQGTDGYMPIAAYPGNEGWRLALELGPGGQHSALEPHCFLERVLPRAHALAAPDQAVLSRSDSGVDSVRLLFQQDDEKRAWAERGRRLDYLVKWNPRRQDLDHWVARDDEVGAWIENRPGKRSALLDLTIERAWQKQKRPFRLIVRLMERAIIAKGQRLLRPKSTLEGRWISLIEMPKQGIARYRGDTTHEQFHSEFKTDLDLRWLTSGKFDGNDLIVLLGQFAYNCLCLMGQSGLTGELSLVRHPAKRRRLKTVLQETMYLAAQFFRKVRKLILDFGQHCPAFEAFAHIQGRLLEAGRSP